MIFNFKKKALCCSSKVSRSLLLLDLGLISVEYKIKQKRICYLHHLLSSEDNSLSKLVLQGQINSPSRLDWIHSVKEDLIEFGINLSFDEIAIMTKQKFKSIVKEAFKYACFKSLMNEKEKLSKGK